ncbi:MAG: HAMP domain-containing protein [Caldilineaceae bacterium]|nr:HAMP domain-containing protein [Caldilineaceae bacterium]
MTKYARKPSIAGQIILVIVALIATTTLAAGVPAYWTVQSQLEAQAWEQLASARQATASLYDAAGMRLGALVTLLSERPTLRRLVIDGNTEALQAYLHDYQVQSQLDAVLFCDPDNQAVGGSLGSLACLPPGPPQWLIDHDSAWLAASAMVLDMAAIPIGTVTAAVRLDEAFVQQMAYNTGSGQLILDAAGRPLVSSLPAPATSRSGDLPGRRALNVNGRRYYAIALPLQDADARTILIAEITLPVDNLLQTGRRGLAILVASTVITALLGAVLGGWLVRRLTRPLGSLTAAAEKISRGDFATPVAATPSTREVATLTSALQRSQEAMVQALTTNEQARAWLQNLVQSISEGVVTYDRHNTITFLNLGAERITGWSSAEAAGKQIADILAPAHGEPAMDLAPPPAGTIRRVEILTRTGRTAVLDVTGAELLPPGGETVQKALVLRDVTEEAAQQKLRAYFLDSITHEFRTPLSTLSASIELLLDPDANLSAEETRELLKPTHMSLLSLQHLVDNLLESSRIEGGHFVVHPLPTDLNGAIADALRLVQPLLERRQQPLTVSEPAQCPPVLADPPRLVQVLVNLLSNASKYSAIGKPVDLLVHERAGVLRVEVADRGPGIPPTERRDLFRRFVRGGAPGSESYGLGLGLHIVKTIVDAHGGRVGVKDRPGGGTIFWFELPLAGTEGMQ